MTDVEKEGEKYEFDSSLSEEEREFYLKAYPSPEYVRDRKAHCTTCKVHIGTAPCNEHGIKMHPILRVTHCSRCHAFYNSGEFSKGEDGSELYCRWCGQGGEVYCCSNCPYVFCKSCITKNLSRGVVADIEQNENWRCFACAPKILWPLRALHWALINYIEKQKKDIEAMNLSESDKKTELSKDRSNCCRLAKAKCGNMSDSLESVDSINSRRSSSSSKKKPGTPVSQTPPAKRTKTSNDEVVCTPDLLSILEPDCQITVQSKQAVRPAQTVTTPKIFTVQQNYMQSQQRGSAPPPLVLRNTGIQLRPVANSPVIRRTVVSPRTPAPAGSNSPVYHTINGYRIDLNSAAQQGTYRLPNGKLIQVKRQSAPNATANNATASPQNNWQQAQASQRPVGTIHTPPLSRTVQITPQRPIVTVQSQPVVSGLSVQQQSQAVRYQSSVIGNTVISSFNQNGSQIQMINGVSAVNTPGQQVSGAAVAVRPVMIRHTFPNNQVGQARTRLQEQIFSAMEICQHLSGKLQTLTNSNAYKQARNLLEVKELYIHLSYLLTYAIGRYKGLQDKCLGDMRQLGFSNDADSLENGQIAAGIDYVRYGQLEDVEMFTSGFNSFHNQIYEYRKSLLANLDDNVKEPLSPLYPLTSLYDDEEVTPEVTGEQESWRSHQAMRRNTIDDDDDDVQEVPLNDEPRDQYMDSFMDEEQQDDFDGVDEEYYSQSTGGGVGGGSMQRGTEDVMRREEESHAYDRKLTRLIEQYPSIWCTRHPDYGNFEVTRKQWRTIASHFKRSEDIKMRWKNIRKRYVRIERRVHEGKRFNGYFDKATNFLINRDTPMSEWVTVDCGTDDGDVYERQKLDAIEKELHKTNEPEKRLSSDFGEHFSMSDSCVPIEIRPLDMKIIHFVKCNPVLWRKSSDPTFNKMDEQTRKSLWMHLWKSVPNIRCSDLIDRWTQMYEMYKTFRLKTIKSENALAALELKYSKYLAKLYFLYKIDEEELQNEYDGLVYGDDLKREEVESEEETKLLDMPDDREFVQQLMHAVREYPQIWNPNHVDYTDVQMREETWREISRKLEQYQRDVKAIKKRWILAKFCYDRLRRERQNLTQDMPLHKLCKNKQASDDEDNEIEIVEPKTDTINLDSDNEEETVPSTANTPASTWTKRRPVSISIATQPSNESKKESEGVNDADQMTDFMDATHNILASMLEIDIVEGSDTIITDDASPSSKQPRKKTINKPNPTLVPQKKVLDWHQLEDMKKNDVKLKSKCVVMVKRAEKEFPYTVGILKQRYEKRKEARRLAAERALREKEEAEKNLSKNEELNEQSIKSSVDELDETNRIDVAKSLEEAAKEENTDKIDSVKEQESIKEHVVSSGSEVVKALNEIEKSSENIESSKQKAESSNTDKEQMEVEKSDLATQNLGDPKNVSENILKPTEFLKDNEDEKEKESNEDQLFKEKEDEREETDSKQATTETDMEVQIKSQPIDKLTEPDKENFSKEIMNSSEEPLKTGSAEDTTDLSKSMDSENEEIKTQPSSSLITPDNSKSLTELNKDSKPLEALETNSKDINECLKTQNDMSSQPTNSIGTGTENEEKLDNVMEEVTAISLQSSETVPSLVAVTGEDTPTNNEDSDFHNSKRDVNSTPQLEFVEKMDVDSSGDISSKSTLNADISTDSTNNDIPNVVEQSSNADSVLTTTI